MNNKVRKNWVDTLVDKIQPDFWKIKAYFRHTNKDIDKDIDNYKLYLALGYLPLFLGILVLSVMLLGLLSTPVGWGIAGVLFTPPAIILTIEITNQVVGFFRRLSVKRALKAIDNDPGIRIMFPQEFSQGFYDFVRKHEIPAIQVLKEMQEMKKNWQTVVINKKNPENVLKDYLTLKYLRPEDKKSPSEEISADREMKKFDTTHFDDEQQKEEFFQKFIEKLQNRKYYFENDKDGESWFVTFSAIFYSTLAESSASENSYDYLVDEEHVERLINYAQKDRPVYEALLSNAEKDANQYLQALRLIDKAWLINSSAEDGKDIFTEKQALALAEKLDYSTISEAFKPYKEAVDDLSSTEIKQFNKAIIAEVEAKDEKISVEEFHQIVESKYNDVVKQPQPVPSREFAGSRKGSLSLPIQEEVLNQNGIQSELDISEQTLSK